MSRSLQRLQLLGLLLLAGCATTTPANVTGAGTQLETRHIQTREYETLDKAMTMRSVIATLQDLGFVIDKADDDLGTVSATKLDTKLTRMTVTVRLRGKGQTVVRASAQHNLIAVSDARPYQHFFEALEKALFLTANEVD